MRIWLKDEGGIGLALTRSFGDELLNKIGVNCVPEIKEFFLEKNDKFIIIGTDGLWEYIPSQECVEIVKDYYLKNDIQGAGNYLYKEASKRWIVEQDVVDDITTSACPSQSSILPDVEDNDGIIQGFTDGNPHESFTLGKLKEQRPRDGVDIIRKRRHYSEPVCRQFGHDDASGCSIMGSDNLNVDELGYL